MDRTAVPFGHYNKRTVLGRFSNEPFFAREKAQHRPFIIMPEGYGGAVHYACFGVSGCYVGAMASVKISTEIHNEQSRSYFIDVSLCFALAMSVNGNRNEKYNANSNDNFKVGDPKEAVGRYRRVPNPLRLAVAPTEYPTHPPTNHPSEEP